MDCSKFIVTVLLDFTTGREIACKLADFTGFFFNIILILFKTGNLSE